jgi:hypothetical protein
MVHAVNLTLEKGPLVYSWRPGLGGNHLAVSIIPQVVFRHSGSHCTVEANEASSSDRTERL